jgi:hypothetical protein
MTTTKKTTPPAVSPQDQLLEGLREGQEALLENVRTWVQAAEKAAAALPTVETPALSAELPEPKEVLASSFDFAEKLLANQRRFAEELIAAVPAK